MATRYRIGGYRKDPANKIYKFFDKNKFSYSGPKDKDVDLRPYSSPRHNQTTTSSCVANALIKALEIKKIMKFGHQNHADLSILNLYWGARSLMFPKETDKDEGTYISLGCDALRKFGVCRESMFPFDKNNIFSTPPVMATREAYINKIKSHFKITSKGDQRLKDIILNLNAGNPIVFGTKVGDQWFDYNKNSSAIGIEKDSVGGHAIVCVGYLNGNFIIENSWGTWGHNGFAFVKPEVLEGNDSSDFWTIVTGSETWYEGS